MTDRLPGCETLLLERSGSTLFLTFNRPHVRNALNAQMWGEIDAVFAAISDDRSIRVVVLRGAGGTFSAGADISERSSLRDGVSGNDAVAARNRRGGEILARIDKASQAVVAVVEGYALGGGFGLVCVADVAIAAASARFGLPEVSLGLAPAQIVPFLLRRIGAAELRRIAVMAGRIDASEALRIGIVHEVGADSWAVDEKLAKVLEQIDRAAPNAIAAAKQLIAMAEIMPEDDMLDRASRILTQLAMSPEGVEGATAFKEKRAPNWRTSTT